ncbi:amino acid ABC transporter substrate-binding protein (PAAT family) [Humibacillus xanthopallidus]|uniref:Amino acid ABC transporter substrate-binding protein (PAAT family) n=1 Tax=Humibacillus xanthopallidus TaxID=412689 RepID=A0A543PVJ0_9MICO|nr:ABC transporter substrate-binding protein [Humibacillus xanthopallidus]TQN48104.1 amino acid ABC transporter substrate-binding protein (PAAT family) [Humibacillus xanthopallidus]
MSARPHTLRRPTTYAVTVLALVTSVALTACSGAAEASNAAAPSAAAAAPVVNTSPDQKRITATKDEAAAALLPQAIRVRGTITAANAGAGGGTPPLVFTADDDKTVIGVEVDLAHLFADKLGLKVETPATSWENVFLGIDSGRYDVALTNVTVTEERKEKYDFATYRKDDLAFEAPKGGTWRVTGRKDIAGKTIAVGSGTNQEKILLDWNEANVKDGLAPAEVKYFQSQTDYYLALASRRIDAYFGPNPSVAYHVSTAGQTEAIGHFSGAGDSLQGLIAVLTKKGSGLAKPYAAAINSAIADGSYAKVLARWNLSSEAVTTSEVNPPGLPKTS